MKADRKSKPHQNRGKPTTNKASDSKIERQQVEEELRRNESRLRLAQKIARLGIWDWDIATDKSIWSGEMFNIYGITPAAFTGNGQDYINFTHPEDRPMQIDNIQKSFENAARRTDLPLAADGTRSVSESSPNQFRIIRPDGSICWVEGAAVAIVDEAGQPVKMVGVLVDITERKQAEDALLEAKIKYRMLVERLPVAVYTSELGINGRWHYISPQIEDLLGFTPEEWMADPTLWYRQVHPDDRDRQEELEEQAWARQESFEGEYRISTRDGRQIWIRNSAQILPPQNNGAPIVQGVLTDITERKHAEDALATSEAELRALFNSMQDVVLVIDRNGVYRKIAPTNPDLLYKPSQEMLGKDLWDILPVEQADVFNNFIQQVLMTRQPAHIEYALPIGDRLTWFAATISLMDADNTLWVARDITERKQAEQMQAVLYQIANVAQTALSLNELFASIHKTLGTFMPAENFYIAMYDAQIDLLSFPYFVDQYDKAPQPQKPGNGLTEYVLRTKQPLLATPQVFEEMINNKLVAAIGMDSIDWIGVPLTVGDETFGVMVIQTYSDKVRLTYRDLEFLTFVSTQAAMVIKRKQGEEELRLTQQHLAGLITSTMDAVISIDNEHKIVLFNPAAEIMFGYEANEILGQPLNILLPEYYRIEHSRQIENFDKSGYTNRHMNGYGEIHGRRRNGEIFATDTSISQINIAGRKLFTAILRDITDRKLAEEAVNQRTSQLEVLREIGLELTAELDVDKLLHSIIAHAFDLLQCTSGGVYLYRPEQKKLELVVSTGTHLAPLGSFIERGEGLSGKVWEQGKPIIVDDYEHWEGRAALFEGKPFKVVMGVPIIKGDEFLGVLILLTDLSRPFNKQDASLLELFAGYAAVAIHNARLYQNARQRLTELEVLYKTSNTLSTEHDLNTLLRSIVENARKLLNSATSGMYLSIPGSDELELSVDTATYIPIGKRVRSGDGLAGHVAQTRQPIRIDDYSTWEGRSEQYEGMSIRAVLEVPMLYRGELIGVLIADETGESERKFTEEDEHLLSLFASQAAGAIHSARLFEETRRRAEEFAGLYQTTRDLSIHQDLPMVLSIITKQAIALLNVPNASITLYDPTRADLELVATIGPDLPLGTRRKVGNGLAGRVAQTQVPIIVEDYQRWEHRSPLFDSIPYAAMMGVPLLYGGNLLGVLDVSEIAPSTRTFSEVDVRLLSLFAGQASSAIANARLFEETVRRLENLQSLRMIDNAISASADVDAILEVILGQVISQLGADAAVILLFDPAEQTLEYAAGRGFRTQALRHTHLILGEGYAGRVAQERKTKHIPDIRAFKTDFLRSPTIAREGFISYFGVPLITKGEIKGVLEVFHRTPFKAGKDWLNFLEMLAGQTAIAIDNTSLYQGLQLSNIELTLAYDATIEGWSRALDLRDKETEGHTQRVTEITLSLAEAMGVSNDELVNIRRGALLHDIGKMGVPDSILLKPGELTNEEWEIMHKHPIYAYEMLTPITYLKNALDIPYCHHEKWDGTGYPRGLQGDNIPLAARIFAVVDVWDAIRSDRPYRQGWDTEKAVEYIKSQSGTHFDPNIVDAFLTLLKVHQDKRLG